MRNRLILPPPPLGASNEGLKQAEESLALRLYIIPVPILDLRPPCGASAIEEPVVGAERVDKELVGGGEVFMLPTFPVTRGELGTNFEIDTCC